MASEEYQKQVYRHVCSKLRVKIKSLAEEAKIIRYEERRRRGWVKLSLQLHRINDVRAEQRATFLAYAFYRRRPYSSVEFRCNKPVPIATIKRILKSMSSTPVDVKDIASWVESRGAIAA